MPEENRTILISVGKEETARKDVEGALICAASITEALLSRGWHPEIFSVTKDDFAHRDSLKTRILNADPACVFNIFEGFSDDSAKEAEFVRILESMGLPFTGNSVETLYTCLDKAKTKDILRHKNIPVPQGYCIRQYEELNGVNLKFPLFIKPCCEDASVGIDHDSLIDTEPQLYSVVKKKLADFPGGLLIEEFIPGTEYNVGFIGAYPCEVMGISVLEYQGKNNAPRYLSFDSKWEEASDEYKKLTPIPGKDIHPQLKQKIIDVSTRTGQALECRSYFRVDLREKNGDVFVLDVNPNPDINKDSGFIRQAHSKGYRYEDVIEKILLAAIKQYTY